MGGSEWLLWRENDRDEVGEGLSPDGRSYGRQGGTALDHPGFESFKRRRSYNFMEPDRQLIGMPQPKPPSVQSSAVNVLGAAMASGSGTKSC